ncbi:MAG TPA: hypothetical protein ENJ01_07265 [Gammaproteobacteria bacterium]|nr:hypothetical protein [Gammaproteobacteria bacterium]
MSQLPDTTVTRMRRWWPDHARRLVLVLACLLPALAGAGPVSGIVFDDVTWVRKADHYRIRIGFNYPVQYVWHHPPSPRQEVLVRIRLLEANALEGRMPVREESAALDSHMKRLFEDVRFDGTDPMTPLVVLRFTHPQHFRIEQGGDWRSLVLYLFDEPRWGDVAPPEAEVIEEEDSESSTGMDEDRP